MTQQGSHRTYFPLTFHYCKWWYRIQVQCFANPVLFPVPRKLMTLYAHEIDWGTHWALGLYPSEQSNNNPCRSLSTCDIQMEPEWNKKVVLLLLQQTSGPKQSRRSVFKDLSWSVQISFWHWFPGTLSWLLHYSPIASKTLTSPPTHQNMPQLVSMKQWISLSVV